MASGEPSADVLADLVARDDGQAIRQVHMIDSASRIAAHTGSGCVDLCGHVAGDAVSVAGNMLAGPAVVADAQAAFEANGHLPLAERLMAAMNAGEEAGGDKRGKQSAALVVHRMEDYPWISLRADDHPDPLEELRRLYDVAQERFVHVAEAMPTRANFSGTTDRADVDSAIAAAEAERKIWGKPSRSFATEPNGNG